MNVAIVALFWYEGASLIIIYAEHVNYVFGFKRHIIFQQIFKTIFLSIFIAMLFNNIYLIVFGNRCIQI